MTMTVQEIVNQIEALRREQMGHVAAASECAGGIKALTMMLQQAAAKPDKKGAKGKEGENDNLQSIDLNAQAIVPPNRANRRKAASAVKTATKPAAARKPAPKKAGKGKK